MSWSDHKEWRYVLSWSDLSGLNALPTGLDRLGFEWVASWNNQLGFSDAKSRCNFELSPMYHGIWCSRRQGSSLQYMRGASPALLHENEHQISCTVGSVFDVGYIGEVGAWFQKPYCGYNKSASVLIKCAWALNCCKVSALFKQQHNRKIKSMGRRVRL